MIRFWKAKYPGLGFGLCCLWEQYSDSPNQRLYGCRCNAYSWSLWIHGMRIKKDNAHKMPATQESLPMLPFLSYLSSSSSLSLQKPLSGLRRGEMEKDTDGLESPIYQRTFPYLLIILEPVSFNSALLLLQYLQGW